MASFPGARSTVTTVAAMIATRALGGTAQAFDLGPGRLDTEFAAVVEGSRTVEVGNDDALREALDTAAPGDVIRLAPGVYEPVEITGDGTADAPITLTGPRRAVIVGDGGYTVHIRDARHWQLIGFTVRGGGKGVVLDNAQSVLLDSLTVGRTGSAAPRGLPPALPGHGPAARANPARGS